MWYAIRTEPGQEESMKLQIRSQMRGRERNNCKVLYRACKKRYLGAWHEETEVFLPGYLFLVSEERDYGPRCLYERIKIAGDIWNWGEYGTKEIQPVGKDGEELLEKLTEGTNEIGMSYGVIQNGVLKISRGVLVGMESRVRKIDRHKRKCYICVPFDNEEKEAEVGLEIMEKTWAAQDLLDKSF